MTEDEARAFFGVDPLPPEPDFPLAPRPAPAPDPATVAAQAAKEEAARAILGIPAPPRPPTAAAVAAARKQEEALEQIGNLARANRETRPHLEARPASNRAGWSAFGGSRGWDTFTGSGWTASETPPSGA